MTELDVHLDRASPVPLYFQVAQQIEQAISDGVLAPGDRIDNEITLAEQIGLSRPTMRRAIQELVDKGLLVRKRGVGTQVVHGQMTRPLALTSLFDDLTDHHQAPTTTMLTNEVIPAPDEISVKAVDRAGNPGTASAAPAVDPRRAARDLENYLPENLIGIGQDDLETGGLYQLMRARGVRLRVAKQKIGARTGSPTECKMLGERKGSPLLTMERAAHDDCGRTVEGGTHAYRASRYTYEVTLVAR